MSSSWMNVSFCQYNCKEFVDHPFRVTHRTNEFIDYSKNEFCDRTCVVIRPKARFRQVTH